MAYIWGVSSQKESEVYERIVKSVILVVKRPFKGLKDAFYGCTKVVKMFWFCILFILNRTCTYSS